MWRRHLLLSAALAGWVALPVTASAAAAAAATTGDEIVITADRVGLLEVRPTNTVFGLKKALIETPRSASFVSATTLDRYGILTLDRLTAVSPGTYTDSFYGVAGSVEIRGTLAENYFQGFKRIENRGTYTTPVGDASELQVLRGPPEPNFGPGKVGGLVNFIPKSANDSGAYLTHPIGEVTLTAGSYDKKNGAAQVGLPVRRGAVHGGLYAYGEVDDSGSFYDGIHPKHQLGEVSVNFDLGGGWNTAFDGMVYHSTGDVQTPGWNRVTQALINNRTYITGHNTVLVDSNHDGRLEPIEVSPGGVYPFTTSLYTPYFGFPPAIDPRFVLDTGVDTTKLSPHTVFISPADFSTTNTETFYINLAKDLSGGGSLKIEEFYDFLGNKRFVSYGFPADYHAWTEETRVSLSTSGALANGLIATNNLIGAADRYYKGDAKETFDSGLISVDRRDLSVGATPTDIFSSPFDNEPGHLGWENDVHSRWNDVGVFETSDITIAHRLNVIVGGRYDYYTATSQDVGIFAFETPKVVSGSKGKWTYTASASYKLPWGLLPYVTYDHAATLELEQAGDIKPSHIQGAGFVSNSTLAEAGVKFQFFNKTLLGAVDVYRQTRTDLAGLNSIVQPSVGKGFEYELRYLATSNVSLTVAGNFQHTEIIGPDNTVIYLPPAVVGVPGIDGYGGGFLTFNFSRFGGQPGSYNNNLIPHAVGSIYVNYVSNEYSWGTWGATAGATYASKTSGNIPNPVVYPAYELANISVFYKRGSWGIALNIDNLFDRLYFTATQDPTYSNLAVLPGVGRELRATLSRTF